MKGNGVTTDTLQETVTPNILDEMPDPYAPVKPFDQEQIARVIERMLHSGQHKTVFGEPVVVGEYTLITACEVASGGGFGVGMGPVTGEAKATSILGSGGGGGAGSIGRPIAVIIAGPDGVKVKPIVDVTRFMITFFTAWKVVASAAMLAWRKIGPRMTKARK